MYKTTTATTTWPVSFQEGEIRQLKEKIANKQLQDFQTEYLIQTGTDQQFKIQSEYIIKQTLLSTLTHKEVTRTSP